MTHRILHGDAIEQMRTLPDNSVDAIVTDPPAGIAFMGKDWDNPNTFPLRDRGALVGTDNPQQTAHAHDRGFANGMTYGKSKRARDAFVDWLTDVMAEAHRVLKPGGHALVWALPRTSHWTALALEDAGFEIRDSIQHLFGSGFPKSLSVDKAIDKMRNDDIRPVCRFLRAAIDASPHTVKSIAEQFGFHSRMVEHWAARDTDSQPSVPKWEQWQQLRELLGFGGEMDAEVWRLNGRKGKPGDAWHEREVIGVAVSQGGRSGSTSSVGQYLIDAGKTFDITAPATPDAERWQGWGTALKPSHEVWWLCRKPLAEKTVAAQVLATGTGALNIDGCRIGIDDVEREAIDKRCGSHSGIDGGDIYGNGIGYRATGERFKSHAAGRWPSNVILSHHPDCVPCGVKRVKTGTQGSTRGRGSEIYANGKGYANTVSEVGQEIGYADPDGYETVAAYRCHESCPVRLLDAQSGVSKSTGGQASLGAFRNGDIYGKGRDEREARDPGYGDTGGASRFFYTAKASRKERRGSKHPTVKSLSLMRYLVRLITPPGGTVLDCFAGSGTTGEACVLEGFGCILIEREEEYVKDIQARFRAVQPPLEMVAG